LGTRMPSSFAARVSSPREAFFPPTEERSVMQRLSNHRMRPAGGRAGEGHAAEATASAEARFFAGGIIRAGWVEEGWSVDAGCCSVAMARGGPHGPCIGRGGSGRLWDGPPSLPHPAMAPDGELPVSARYGTRHAKGFPKSHNSDSAARQASPPGRFGHRRYRPARSFRPCVIPPVVSPRASPEAVCECCQNRRLRTPR
jgi:hypothetical protein